MCVLPASWLPLSDMVLDCTSTREEYLQEHNWSQHLQVFNHILLVWMKLIGFFEKDSK